MQLIHSVLTLGEATAPAHKPLFLRSNPPKAPWWESLPDPARSNWRARAERGREAEQRRRELAEAEHQTQLEE